MPALTVFLTRLVKNTDLDLAVSSCVEGGSGTLEDSSTCFIVDHVLTIFNQSSLHYEVQIILVASEATLLKNQECAIEANFLSCSFLDGYRAAQDISLLSPVTSSVSFWLSFSTAVNGFETCIVFNLLSFKPSMLS